MVNKYNVPKDIPSEELMTKIFNDGLENYEEYHIKTIFDETIEENKHLYFFYISDKTKKILFNVFRILKNHKFRPIYIKEGNLWAIYVRDYEEEIYINKFNTRK